ARRSASQSPRAPSGAQTQDQAGSARSRRPARRVSVSLGCNSFSYSFRETSSSAGGLAQSDTSGNGPIQGIVGSAVSPHPDPLPQGEETACIAQWKAKRSGLFSAWRMVHPLPEGEGWGEGKQTTARRSANVLDLSCDRCPLG